jgi:EAL domain-containing protein (putative c-di-GMP-specific phosphodiesterase class I)
MIEPAEFIPLAEGDRQTIRELTLHTLEVAARDLIGWTRAPRIPVVVNLSPAALEQPELPGALAGILERTGLPPDRLGIEVTESAIAGEHSSVADALGEIRGLGVKTTSAGPCPRRSWRAGSSGASPISPVRSPRTARRARARPA